MLARTGPDRCRERPPRSDEEYTESAHEKSRSTGDSTITPTLDWVLGANVALGGLLFATIGAITLVVPVRDSLTALVATRYISADGLTEGETVALVLAMVTWVAIGLLVVGLIMLVLGISYIKHRRRLLSRMDAGESTSDVIAHALLGAIVSAVTSFVPISPMIGGGIAGYMERRHSNRSVSVGALSGAMLIAPFLVLSVFFAAGFVAGFSRIGGTTVGAIAGGLLIFGTVILLGVATVLGAAGGWIGRRVADRADET